MISEDTAGKTIFRVGDMSSFLSIIEEQFKVYSDFLHKRPVIENLEHEQILRLNHHQIDPLYITTIFTALYLEAFIYDYCSRKESSSFAKSIDKLDPPTKWIIGTRLCNPTGIDSSKARGIIKIY